MSGELVNVVVLGECGELKEHLYVSVGDEVQVVFMFL